MLLSVTMAFLWLFSHAFSWSGLISESLKLEGLFLASATISQKRKKKMSFKIVSSPLPSGMTGEDWPPRPSSQQVSFSWEVAEKSLPPSCPQPLSLFPVQCTDEQTERPERGRNLPEWHSRETQSPLLQSLGSSYNSGGCEGGGGSQI